MAESFRLYLLGGFRLERDDHEIVLPRAKVKTLLAYLALHPQEQPRETLASLFWGDSPDEQARTSLRVALNALRAAIHPNILLADRETAQLNPDVALWVDARALGDWRLEIGDSISSLQSLVSFYRGELLAGFYDEWIEPEREKYRDAYLELLLRVVEQYRAASDYVNATVYAQKVLETDRAHETAHQHLIFLYAAQGDHIAALKQFDECVAALDEEFGVEPSPETLALAKQINKKPLTKSDAAAQTNLPKPLTSFVGREREIEEIRGLLTTDDGRRTADAPRHPSLVTFTGAGGSGKTRLAIQVGRALLEQYADGVWWVELAPLADAELVPQQIAKALGIQQEANEPITQTLANALRERELLLILDNCEHLIDACAEITQALVSNTPISILATSREALNIPGEQIFPVAPLDLPRAALATFVANAMDFSAVRLFVERARLADARFEMNELTVLPITQICTRLDGIPLAIELAAARVKQLSVSEIAARLDSRFDLLIGTRTAAPRQQTLRALIDWSYNLLSDDERDGLQRLAVFAGGWTLEACDRVIERKRDREQDSLHHAISPSLNLTALVDKSLVVADTRADETRYRMLEMIREYAREKLEQAGKERDARAKHLAYFVQVAEDAAPRLWGRETLLTLNRLELEHDNFRAALRFALDTDEIENAVALAGALGTFWQLRNYLDEAEHWYAQLLERDTAEISPRRRAWLYSSAGTIAWAISDFARAERLHRRALELFEQAEDAHGIALSLNNIGVQLGRMGKVEQARACFEQALALARKHNDAQLIAHALTSLAIQMSVSENAAEIEAYYAQVQQIAEREGDAQTLAILGANLTELLRERGEYARALESSTTALRSAHAVGNQQVIHFLVREQASVLALLGRFDEAKAALYEAFALAQKHKDPWTLGGAFSRWGWLEYLMGNFAPATLLFGYSQARLESLQNASLSSSQTTRINEITAELRVRLGAERFEQEWARGRAMSQAQALEVVFSEQT